MEKKNKKTSVWSYFNKKINFDYLLIKSYQAGLVLKGHEVKKILSNQFDPQNTFVSIDQSLEAFLVNLKISDPQIKKQRRIKLLLHKQEILWIKNKISEQNLTIVLQKLYLCHNKIKAIIVIAKGKKKYQKRQKLIEKTLKKEIKNKNFLKKSIKYSCKN